MTLTPEEFERFRLAIAEMPVPYLDVLQEAITKRMRELGVKVSRTGKPGTWKEYGE